MWFEQLQFQSGVALGNSKPKELVCLQIREMPWPAQAYWRQGFILLSSIFNEHIKGKKIIVDKRNRWKTGILNSQLLQWPFLHGPRSTFNPSLSSCSSRLYYTAVPNPNPNYLFFSIPAPVEVQLRKNSPAGYTSCCSQMGLRKPDLSTQIQNRNLPPGSQLEA